MKTLKWLYTYGPGLLFALTIAVVSYYLGQKTPIIGGPIFGVVIGVFIGNVFKLPGITVKGLDFTSKKILQASIVLLGAGLSLNQVWQTGIQSLYLMFFTLSAAFITAYGLGKLLKIPLNLTSLIGVGTAICGGSAIAAISPIIEAEETEIAYAISTIFLFNLLAVIAFPTLGHLLKFSNQAFGLWAGTAINDTSSVVAAGYAYSNAAGAYATIVKLTRTTMIIPISLIFTAVVAANKKRGAEGKTNINYSFKKIFPWFILWFLVASMLNTIGIFTTPQVTFLNSLGKFMIVLALSAIGLKTDLGKIRKTGLKPMLLGLLVWFIVTIVSLGVQFASGQV